MKLKPYLKVTLFSSALLFSSLLVDQVKAEEAPGQSQTQPASQNVSATDSDSAKKTENESTPTTPADTSQENVSSETGLADKGSEKDDTKPNSESDAAGEKKTDSQPEQSKQTDQQVDAGDKEKESEKLNPKESAEAKALYQRVVTKGTAPKGETALAKESSEGITVDRVHGANRFSNAVAISQAGWEKSDYVLIANGYMYADALTSAPLAAVYNAPLLLTKDKTIEDTTLAEIERLQAKHIILLGGTKSIHEDISKVLEYQGYAVRRIGGKNRYEQAALVAEEVMAATGSRDAFLASGELFSDALSISNIAAAKKLPIYLTRGNRLEQAVIDAIPKVNTWTLIGGEKTISKAVENRLTSLGGRVVKRFEGKNRYEVNRNITDWYYNDRLSHFYVVSGELYSDGLPAAMLAAKKGSALLLVKNNQGTLKEQTDFSVGKRKIKKYTIIGGATTVSPETEVTLNTPKAIFSPKKKEVNTMNQAAELLTYIMIAGHGDGDPGATGRIAKGENRYMKENLFPAMRKYLPAGVNVVWVENQNVYARDTLLPLVKEHGGADKTEVIEWHYDWANNPSRSGGHVIISGRSNADQLDLAIRDAIQKNVGLDHSYNFKGHSGISGRNDLRNPNRAQSGDVNYRLVELGFGSSPADANHMVNNVNQYAKDLVKAIFGKTK
ncbi:hypothetical protein AWM75_05880 [Aerococcus urinaehominis]|uniref:Uncharacterized protein n=1 Tax=Aerococcus urinaehominis TaxID=128944 RepID=A0A0X8FLJ8_9LACT|nr:cell wall-binding repeat-containing protein [Aerococcus urinaehominis]AMB99553.1 hypothetical protein AWM75_05880 [Aerococcus urinaehominis]SDM34912.1 Putative cell wall binding repeat 2 [Aerococcus urinaehominis]